MPEVWGDGQEEQPYIQEVAAALVQEGREELLHIQSQEGVTSSKVKELMLRYARAAVKRYSPSKVRETQVRW